jgi:hypothetical protein
MAQAHAPNSPPTGERLRPKPEKPPRPAPKSQIPPRHDWLGPAGDPAEGRRD